MISEKELVKLILKLEKKEISPYDLIAWREYKATLSAYYKCLGRKLTAIDWGYVPIEHINDGTENGKIIALQG